MLDPELLKRITVRRAELDEPEEQRVNSLGKCGPSGTNLPSPNGSLNG
ncbi:hypothetical protein [Streptomyces anulatus]